MSTAGVAHHQRGTFPLIDSGADFERRRARYAAPDAAYRALLGLAEGAPLPRSIGRTVGHSAGAGFTSSAAGGRVRRRIGEAL